MDATAPEFFAVDLHLDETHRHGIFARALCLFVIVENPELLADQIGKPRHKRRQRAVARTLNDRRLAVH